MWRTAAPQGGLTVSRYHLAPRSLGLRCPDDMSQTAKPTVLPRRTTPDSLRGWGFIACPLTLCRREICASRFGNTPGTLLTIEKAIISAVARKMRRYIANVAVL